jgi:hypothetical protein
MGLKHTDIGCSTKQSNLWVQEGFLVPPERADQHGHRGAAWTWDDDTIDRVKVIKASLLDKRNFENAAFELFLHGFSFLHKPELLRDVLLKWLDVQLHILFYNRPTIPSEPGPSDRRYIQQRARNLDMRAEKLDILLKARDQDFYLQMLSQQAGVPRNFGENKYWPGLLHLPKQPSLHELKTLVKEAKGNALEEARANANAFLLNSREQLEYAFYVMGLSPEDATRMFLLGHACKQPHTLVHALLPSTTVHLLASPDWHPEIEDIRADITSMEAILEKVLPSLDLEKVLPNPHDALRFLPSR